MGIIVKAPVFAEQSFKIIITAVAIMISCNRNSFKAIRVLLVGSALLLTACHSDYGPFPMPSGYKHHDEIYKAPPGPEPVLKHIQNKRTAQSADESCQTCDNAAPMNNGTAIDNMAMNTNSYTAAYGPWDDAAGDLVRRLFAGFGQPAEAIFVKPGSNEAEMNLEKALRRALQEKGANVAPAPGLGPFTLRYNMKPMGLSDGTRSMVTLTLMGANGEVLAEETGIYGLMQTAPMVDVPAPHETGAMSSGAPTPISP